MIFPYRLCSEPRASSPCCKHSRRSCAPGPLHLLSVSLPWGVYRISEPCSIIPTLFPCWFSIYFLSFSSEINFTEVNTLVCFLLNLQGLEQKLVCRGARSMYEERINVYKSEKAQAVRERHSSVLCCEQGRWAWCWPRCREMETTRFRFNKRRALIISTGVRCLVPRKVPEFQLRAPLSGLSLRKHRGAHGICDNCGAVYRSVCGVVHS